MFESTFPFKDKLEQCNTALKLHNQIFSFFNNAYDYGTYRNSEQHKLWRLCAFMQTRRSFRYSPTLYVQAANSRSELRRLIITHESMVCENGSAQEHVVHKRGHLLQIAAFHRICNVCLGDE